MIEGHTQRPEPGERREAPLDPALRGLPRGVITFFYYADLPTAASYYRDIIGLRSQMVSDWCVIFDLGAGARLGLVNSVAGSQRPIVGRNKGAILSLEVDDVAACLDRLKRLGAAEPTVQMEYGCGGLTREFKILDPGGYTLEFFCWSSMGAQISS